MRTTRQGTFDGLCGVYAILNALDPAGFKRPRGQLHAALFKELTYGLGSVSLLSAMHDGLEPKDLLRAGRAAFRWLSLEHGITLSIAAPYAKRQFKTPNSFLDVVRGHLDASGEAVILYVVMPGRDHWTVPAGIVGQKLILRDFGGMTSLPLRQLMSASSGIRLSPQHTLVISHQAA